MNLPAYYTVAEVIAALEFKYQYAECNHAEFLAAYNEAKEPKYVKTWFGYYRNITPQPMMFDEWPNGFEVRHYAKECRDLSSKLSALRELPLDAKVKLTVEEINDLFNTKETN